MVVTVRIRAVGDDPSKFFDEIVEDSISPKDIAAIAKIEIDSIQAISSKRFQVYTESGELFTNEVPLDDDMEFHVTAYREKEPDPDNLIRVGVLGAGGVGKTSIIRRYMDGTFKEAGDGKEEDEYRLCKYIDGQLAQFCFMDTNLLEQSVQYDGILLVFSMSNDRSLEELPKFTAKIKALEVGPIFYVVGNKADLGDNPGLWEKATKEVNELGCVGMKKTSARTGLNIEKAFANLVREIRRNRLKADDNEVQPVAPNNSCCSIL